MKWGDLTAMVEQAGVLPSDELDGIQFDGSIHNTVRIVRDVFNRVGGERNIARLRVMGGKETS